MLGEMAVKHMPMVAKRKPAIKENGIISRDEGNSRIPKAASTGSIKIVFIILRVAPHRISPVITSSIVRGVAIMASKVFWKYIRTNEAKVHSKKDVFMIVTAIRAGAMNLI
jgi:GT2 family glycosyltransferase